MADLTEAKSFIKDVRRGRARAIKIRGVPREGTHLRYWYDVFTNNPLTVIEARTIAHSAYVNQVNCLGCRTLQDLIDYYGLDIRHIGRMRYMLVGRWRGMHYTDYLEGKSVQEVCDVLSQNPALIDQ